MDKNQLYGLMLEDYSSPRYQPWAKPYFGTRQDMLNFTDRLENDGRTAGAYEALIKGIRMYTENSPARHTVCGDVYPVLFPAKELGQKEIVLTDHMWIHQCASTGNSYLLRAKAVWLRYIWVECGSTVIRCCRASFDSLAISDPGMGWIYWAYTSKGFPAMSYYEPYGNNEEGVTHLSLYCSDKLYEAEEAKTSTIDESPGMLDVDLMEVIGEIIGIM